MGIGPGKWNIREISCLKSVSYVAAQVLSEVAVGPRLREPGEQAKVLYAL
jgi:hypothetical protein